MCFGILFGRFSVLSPPLKRAYRNLDNLTEIVASVCPPEAKVAMVADTGIPLIKIHTSELSYQVAYFGSKESISKFQKKLSKDKTNSSHNNSLPKSMDTEPESVSESESERSEETDSCLTQENQLELSISLTSPIKYSGHNVSQDSGFGSPELNKASCSFERKMSDDDSATPEKRKEVNATPEKRKEVDPTPEKRKELDPTPEKRKEGDPTAEAIQKVDPMVDTMELAQERYRHFIVLLHKCSLERDKAQSLEIDLIRKFFANSEKKSPFNNAEIDACIDKMAFEKKVMRSDDIVFIL